MSKVAYWGGSAAVGGALAILFWILFSTSTGANHSAYMAAAIACTVIAVICVIGTAVTAKSH